MARVKKDYHPFSIRMDLETYNRLTDFCEESGQSKTLAIERAINMYINDYNEKMEQIMRLSNKKN